MAVREIKTSIELGGEKEFEAQLKDINRTLKVTDSELKALRTGFDLTDDKQGNLTRQSQLTKEKLEQQRAVVSGLEREVSVLADSYGENSREVQAMAIRLNNARAKMNDLQKASEAADREVEEFGRDSTKVGRQIENGIGDAAEDTTKSLKDMVSEINEGVGSIKSSTMISAAIDFGGKVIDFVQGVNSFAEGTREYNRQMSFLEQNANTYGQSLEWTKQKAFEVAAITGQTDSAVEGLSNLLATGMDTSELEIAIEGLEGAVTRFPDTMKFENLAEGLRQTLEQEEATGQFADLLNALGVDVEEFNIALEKSTTAEGDQQIVLSYLRGELQETAQAYKDANDDMIAATESSSAVNDEINELGGILDVWLTPGRNAFATFLNGINETLKDIQENAEGTGSIFDVFKVSGSSAGDLADAYIYDREGLEASYGPGGIPEDTMKMMYNDLASSGRLSLLPADDPIYQYGVDAGQSFGDGMTEGLATMTEESTAAVQEHGGTVGQTFGIGMAEGLAGQTDLVVGKVDTMVEQINASTAGVNDIVIGVRYGTPSQTTPLPTPGTFNGTVNLDGRKVGTAIWTYLNGTMGQTTAQKIQQQATGVQGYGR